MVVMAAADFPLPLQPLRPRFLHHTVLRLNDSSGASNAPKTPLPVYHTATLPHCHTAPQWSPTDAKPYVSCAADFER